MVVGDEADDLATSARVHQVADALSVSLGTFGGSQNISKTCVIPILAGPGSRNTRTLQSVDNVPGKSVDNVRALGTWINNTGTFFHECKNKLQSLNAAHAEVGPLIAMKKVYTLPIQAFAYLPYPK